MEEIYKALGWQGGTIHQIINEIERLKTIEKCAKNILILDKVLESFNKEEK